MADKCGQIYNMDERGIPLDHRSPRVWSRRVLKKLGIVLRISDYCCWMHKCNWTNTDPFVVFEAKILTFNGQKVRCLAQLTD